MKIRFLALSILAMLSHFAAASDEATFSLSLTGVTASIEKEVSKPNEGNQETQQITSVDTFGLDGRSTLPAVRLGLEIDKYVIYAYPNAAPGGREIWLGIKTDEDTEVGVIVGTQHLVYNPATTVEGKSAKLTSADRLGLFVNRRMSFDDQHFDLRLSPWYSMVNKSFSDRSFDSSSSELGFSADALWIWEIESNLELGFGVNVGWSQSKEKVGGTENRTVTWSRMGLTLAEATVFF
jgi:hypothetical protein